MATRNRPALARRVRTDAKNVHVELTDGRELTIAFANHRFLRGATPVERRRCVVSDDGMAIWWSGLSEGISVAGLLGVREAALERLADEVRVRRGLLPARRNAS
jgi:hypothetical protein